MNLASDSPFQLHLCFASIFEQLEQTAAGPSGPDATRAAQLLADAAPFPELREGITSEAQITGNADLISRLLRDYFPPALTQNEIKAVNIPFTGIIFNHTERFRNILQAAGPAFDITIRDFDKDEHYIMSCCLILNEFYGTRLDFSVPLFYDIPTANGVMRHYRILYNADFMDIVPTERSLPLTPADIDLLLDNYEDVALWKQKFPEGSWSLKGFAILTLFDATVENAVSLLKEKLLTIHANGFRESVESIFQSIYRIPDILVGFTAFNAEEGKFTPDTFGQQLPSFLLTAQKHEEAQCFLCPASYHSLIQEQVYYAVSDTKTILDSMPANHLARHFYEQGIRSCILAPVVKNQRLYGILEIISVRPKELNSINANKLEVVMPFLTDTIERLDAELEHQVQAVIQEKYTTIHGSVYWKFRAAAQQQIFHQQIGTDYTLQEIVFPDVFPLYGQIDIKGSSDARNQSVQKDLHKQLQTLAALLQALNSQDATQPFHAEEQQLQHYLAELSQPLKAGTEQYISDYLAAVVHPRLQRMASANALPAINQYFAATFKDEGDFHTYRRQYETTIGLINEQLANVIDSRQPAAQAIFPHYYERFKTDGVEHNLYIGASIAPKKEFDIQKLHALRLWEFRLLCEMERAHHQLRPTLPYPLEVTSLILVYHTIIDIRFRMDEKRFDVDGSYNARFEIVKKRIDKACIKHTTERITQPGKITIVYSNDMEEQEYLQYIHTLQTEQLLTSEVEQHEVEDLQGVSGLKILRVGIAHHPG